MCFFSFFDSEYLCKGKQTRTKTRTISVVSTTCYEKVRSERNRGSKLNSLLSRLSSIRVTHAPVQVVEKRVNQNTKITFWNSGKLYFYVFKVEFSFKSKWGKLKKMDDMLQRLWAGHTMLQVCTLLYVLFTLWSTSKAFMNHIIYVSPDRVGSSLSPQSRMWIMCVFPWICISHSQKMAKHSTHTTSPPAPLCGGFPSLNPISCTPGATLTR